jgi:hypothetical protein
VVEVLNAIYEEDFLGFSYGFRPGRSQHDALDALAVAITGRKVSFVLDADMVILVRYADDIVAGFQYQGDAERFQAELEARLEAFSLAVNPDKTRLIEFGRFAAETRKRRGLGKPETFTFLGFTHICSRCRRGRFQLKRRSCRKRQRAKLRTIKQDLRRQMHQPVGQQGQWLRQVVSGYFAYHAVPGNYTSLGAFRYHVIDLWRRELRRRGQKRPMTWARIARPAERWLPKPPILHPWPSQRFAVKHPREEPGALAAHAGICAGCALESAWSSVAWDGDRGKA